MGETPYSEQLQYDPTNGAGCPNDSKRDGHVTEGSRKMKDRLRLSHQQPS
jgi:hypothetical protein